MDSFSLKRQDSLFNKMKLSNREEWVNYIVLAIVKGNFIIGCCAVLDFIITDGLY